VGEADTERDDQLLHDYATALADAVDAALPGWVVRAVEQRFTQWRPGERLPAEVRATVAEAGEAARRATVPEVKALLGTDVDAQRANPLAILRRAVRYPTEVLRALGVPPADRDEHQRRLFPDDDYDLSPATFADIHPSLHEPGLMWGAAKAHVVLSRRRAEGRR
jgi:hypothetical protein